MSAAEIQNPIFLGSNYALMQAIRDLDIVSIIALCEQTPEAINQPTPEGDMPIIRAVEQIILSTMAESDDDYRTALEILGVLIEHGANLDPDGPTPLLVASEYGNCTLVRILLLAGAGVNRPMNNGATPLYIASQNGHNEVVLELLQAGAVVAQCKNNGASPLYIASQNGHNEVVQVLVKAGAPLDLPKEDGAMPFGIACQECHVDVVKTLFIAGGAVVEAMCNGMTPLELVRLLHDTPNQSDEARLSFSVIIELLKKGLLLSKFMEEGDPTYLNELCQDLSAEIAGVLKQKIEVVIKELPLSLCHRVTGYQQLIHILDNPDQLSSDQITQMYKEMTVPTSLEFWAIIQYIENLLDGHTDLNTIEAIPSRMLQLMTLILDHIPDSQAKQSILEALGIRKLEMELDALVQSAYNKLTGEFSPTELYEFLKKIQTYAMLLCIIFVESSHQLQEI
ncbi:MAG UNVERIFIED_CONTAM: ankyrin repeat domain-containing protein [Rickettsiaceae bacterium]|jgi:ankyrin repeat protein